MLKLHWRFWGWCRSTHVQTALAVLEMVLVMAKAAHGTELT